MAELINGMDIFEPSCGMGDLADVIYERAPEHLICNEINTGMKKYLDGKPYTTMYDDFMAYKPTTIRPFDRIVMNPPFSRQQDIDHVLHAYNHLKPGGMLVSVMSVSWTFRNNKKSIEFRAWLEQNNAEIIDIESGAFKASGTLIPTKIIKIRRNGL